MVGGILRFNVYSKEGIHGRVEFPKHRLGIGEEVWMYQGSNLARERVRASTMREMFDCCGNAFRSGNARHTHCAGIFKNRPMHLQQHCPTTIPPLTTSEHLLFMGTKRFPSENEYSQYLSSNNGHSNAWTAMTSTTYFFDVGADALEGALDRFSGFFYEPLFNEVSRVCVCKELEPGR